MAAIPKEFAADSTKVCTLQHDYTSCKVMNDMLNQYVRQAEDERIWMSIDSSGFYITEIYEKRGKHYVKKIERSRGK